MPTPTSAAPPGTPVAVAMSGGVDSSVTAALLARAGLAVRGFFLKLAQPDFARQLERAESVAAFLAIPLEVVDLSREFDKLVLDYFTGAYFRGKTPNPCMLCNPNIKFGSLLRLVRQRSFAFLATGHYARIVRGADGLFRIEKGADRRKDQSYFLSQLGQEQLAHLRFPLGGRTKDEVRSIASDLGLAGRHGAESQDVCFLAGRTLADFLAARAPEPFPAGPIESSDGRRLGSHRGIHAYTVGQRRGLGIPDKSPYYVLALDGPGNRVIVGKQEELWQRVLLAGPVSWVSGREPRLPQRLAVRIRYRHTEAEALIAPGPENLLTVRLERPQRAITPGQFAVFYRDGEMLGGGEIQAGLAGEQYPSKDYFR